MITIDKLKEFEAYRGDYDGFSIQKIQTSTNITSSTEWSLISELFFDAQLVQKNLTSPEFSAGLENSLVQHCDGAESIAYLKTLAAQGW